MFANDLAIDLPGRAVLYLDLDCSRPLSPALVREFDAFCDRAEDAGPEAVAILRLGPGTDAGHGGSWPGDVGIHVVNKWERALRRLERARVVTVAVAQGWCGGPALEVLLSTDCRIGMGDLRLRPPWVAGEIWPGMVVHRLAGQLGIARARDIVLFGTDVSAGKALDLGLIDAVAEDGDAVAGAVATRLRSAGDLAGTELAIRRRLLLDAVTTSFEEALGMHLAACDRTLRRTRQEHRPVPPVREVEEVPAP